MVQQFSFAYPLQMKVSHQSPHLISSPSISKSEPLRALQDPLAPALPPIRGVEIHTEQPHDRNDQNMAPYRDPNRRQIPRTLILLHNETPRNASRTVARRHRRGCKHPLPLPHHVVRLIRRHRRPVRYVRASS